MPHPSSSLPDHVASAWLHDKVYAPRRQRTLEHVTQAVDALVTAKRVVSLAAIVATSKALDPSGRGVSASAILGNTEARACYERYRTWTGRRPARPATRHSPEIAVRPLVRAGRDLARARQRYRRLTKAVLIERLLAVEHALVEQEQRWLRVNDELLALQLRSERRDGAAAPERLAIQDGPAGARQALLLLGENADATHTSLLVRANG